MNVAVHVDTRAVGADLALRVEVAEHGGGDGLVQVGIREDEERGLATKLHRRALHGGSGRCEHFLARANRSRERYFCDAAVACQQRAGPSVPVNDVECAVGKAGLGVDFGKLDRRRRRHLRCLEDHRVAAGEGRRRLPARNLDRIVPSANPGAHPERLPPRVDEGIVERDLLAPQRASDAGEILDAIGPARDIHGLSLLDRLAGVLNTSSSASSRLRARRMSAALPSTRPRSAPESADQRRNPLCAEVMALSTSASSAISTREITSPVAGLTLSKTGALATPA